MFPRPDVVNGLWVHYKGPTYEVYGLSQAEDTGVWYVLYRNPRSGECFHQPATRFMEKFSYLGSYSAR